MHFQNLWKLPVFALFLSCLQGVQPPDGNKMMWQPLSHAIDIGNKILTYKQIEPYTLIRICALIIAFISNNYLAC